MQERRNYNSWWTAIPALPAARDTMAYHRLMRVFSDHTVHTNQSAYNAASERHMIVGFFENFAVDLEHRWIAALADRLGMLHGEIKEARWSYEFEEGVARSKRDGLGIADLVISWRDGAGLAAIVIEAKRPGGVSNQGVASKDDPRRGAYLTYRAMRACSRRMQMLLVSERDAPRLPADLQCDPRVISWEDIARLQIACLCRYAGSVAVEMIATLQDHHRLLGIRVQAEKPQDPLPRQPSEEAKRWLADYRNFISNRADLKPVPSTSWLANEPDQTAMRAAKRQSTRDREAAIWLCPQATEL